MNRIENWKKRIEEHLFSLDEMKEHKQKYETAMRNLFFVS